MWLYVACMLCGLIVVFKMPEVRTRPRQEIPSEKSARLEDAKTRKIRALSGWNIFQRTEMQGKVVRPGEYRQALTHIKRKWAQMSADDRTPFKVQAAHENQQRQKLASTPQMTAREQASEDAALDTKALEQEVGSKGCKKLSARRLVLNEEMHKTHKGWTAVTQFGDSHWDGESAFGSNCSFIKSSSVFRVQT